MGLDEGIPLSYANNSIQINPAECVDNAYEAVEYSFWEDYFDDHEKAVKIFNATISRLDIDPIDDFQASK